jgi:mono/diheme cytochrome c family protein
MKYSLCVVTLIGLLSWSCGSDESKEPSPSQEATDSTNDNTSDTPPTDQQENTAQQKATRSAAALAVFDKYCISCHSEFSSYRSDARWQESGLVIAGKASTSTVITMLQNAGGTMPDGRSPISNDEYTSLLQWIDGM